VCIYIWRSTLACVHVCASARASYSSAHCERAVVVSLSLLYVLLALLLLLLLSVGAAVQL
jgi:hypothetical protein